MKILKYLIMTAASALAICGCSEKDETEKKIDDLLSRMTLHEKIGQMNQLSGGDWLTEAAEKGETLPSLHSPFFRPVPEPTIKTGILALTSAALELLQRP